MTAETKPAEPVPKPSFMAAAKELLARINEHNLVIIAAGIAFYATLALVPTLIALISVYSLVTDPADIASQIAELTADFEDADTAELINEQVTDAASDAKDSGVIALTLGILLALFSASAAVQKLMATVTTAYETTEGRKGWKVRGLAYTFTAGAIIGVVLLTTLLGFVPTIASEVGLGDAARTLITIAAYPIAFLALVGGLTILYRYGPDRERKTGWLNIGAFVGAILFLIFSGLFALYFSIAGQMPASYGILGSIAAIIIFFQLATIAVVLGAETNSIYERHKYGIESVADDRKIKLVPVETIPLGKAVAGLAAIFVLGRNE